MILADPFVVRRMDDRVTDSPADDASQEPALPERAPRKNLMLSASIESETLDAPVRIRNLSETGAMIDGAALPVVGSRVVLHRAELSAAATVVWREGGRCGLRFEQVAASVDEWVAGKREAQGYALPAGQARVDAIQRAVRSGAALPHEPAAATGAGLSATQLEARIAEEIGAVQRLIDGLDEELAEDPVVLQRHMEAIQALDRASQILTHLAAVLGAEDRLAAARAVTMQELRERLLRKAIF